MLNDNAQCANAHFFLETATGSVKHVIFLEIFTLVYDALRKFVIMIGAGKNTRHYNNEYLSQTGHCMNNGLVVYYYIIEYR